MSEHERLVGADRCWACTVSNAVVAALVAGVPLVAALLRGEAIVVAVALAWALVVVGYTLYRLVSRGYLPGSEAVARRTGLHERIGPGATDDETDTDREPGDRRG